MNAPTPRRSAAARRLRALAALLFGLILAGNPAAQVAGPDKKDEDPAKPPVVPPPDTGLVKAMLRYPAQPPASRKDELAKLIKLIEGSAGSMKAEPGRHASLVVQLYRLLPYEKVRQLADKGIELGGEKFVLSHEASTSLAIVRDHMIAEAYRRAAETYRLEFVRLDFGNKQNGVKSDVDHTANVTHGEWEKLEAAIRQKGDPEVKNIRDVIEKEFHALWGIRQEACDICVHSGKNRIPDWRTEQSLAEFGQNLKEVLRGLAETPGAYFHEGAWRLQVEMRSLEAKAKALAELRTAEAEFANAKATAGIPEAELKKAEARLAEVREKNPCTAFRLDKNGKAHADRDISILDALFEGVRGDILKPYSFDVCAGNMIFHAHHADKTECPKYPLRSFDQGVALLRKTAPGKELTCADYARLLAEDSASNGRSRIDLIEELYPGASEAEAAQRERIRLVLDAAARLQQNHSAKTDAERISEFEIWREFITHLHEKGAPREDQSVLSEAQWIKLAKSEYNRRSTELMVLNMKLTVPERIKAWLQPETIAPQYLRLLAEGDLWQELGRKPSTAEVEARLRSELARLQRSSYYSLKIAFANMTIAEVQAIIAKTSGETARNLRLLDKIVSNELRLYGHIDVAPRPAAEPDKPLLKQMQESLAELQEGLAQSYKDFWTAVEFGHYSDEAITRRAWERLYELAGYEYKVPMEIMSAKSGEFIKSLAEIDPKASRWEWKPEAAFGNLFNAGNALSVLNVLKAYQLSGEPKAVIAAMIWEGIYRLPGACVLVAIADAWHGEYFGLQFVLTSTFLDGLKAYATNRGFGAVVPITGHVLTYFMVVKTALEILEHAMFDSLKSESADLMYAGRTGPITPPEEFTADQASLLKASENVMERRRQKLQEGALSLNEEAKEALRNEIRSLRVRIDTLKAAQKTWENYRKAAAGWEAGFLSSGIKLPKEFAFDPILGVAVPLKFYFGRPINEDPGAGPVDLEAKPLTEQERNRLENLRLTEKALVEGKGRSELKGRLDEIRRVRLEKAELETQERLAARAKLYLAKFASDREMEIDARRQNVYYLLAKNLDASMQAKGFVPRDKVKDLPQDKAAEYYTAEEREVEPVAAAYARKWFDECHPQVRGLAILKEALEKQVIPRMARDWKQSEESKDQFESIQLSLREAMRDQLETQHAILTNFATQTAMEKFLAPGAESCPDLGTVLLASAVPEEQKPIIRLTGYVEGEGDAREVKLRVKVLASGLLFEAPYTQKFGKKSVKLPDGTVENLVFAELADKNGKLMGRSNDLSLMPAPLAAGDLTIEKRRSERDGRPEGLFLIPSPVQGAAAYDILRATEAGGSWLTAVRDSLSDAPRPPYDTYPLHFPGKNTWLYAAVPKARNDLFFPLENPDTSKAMRVTLDLSLEPPLLRAETVKEKVEMEPLVLPETLSPEDRESRTRQHQRLLAQRSFTARQTLTISWEAPKMGEDLAQTKTAKLQIFRADKADGLFRQVAVKDAAEKYEENTDALEGRTYYYKARWLVPTARGERQSEFSGPLAATMPRTAINGALGRWLPAGPGQRFEFKTEQFEVVPSSDFKSFFKPHGAGGMEEGTLQAFSEDRRQQLAARTFSYHFEVADRLQGEERKAAAAVLNKIEGESGRLPVAAFQQWAQDQRFQPSGSFRTPEERARLVEKAIADLNKRLADFDNPKSHYSESFGSIKQNAPLASVPLGAVIGRFELSPPAPANPANPAAPAKPPVPVYFPINAGAEFTAPGFGRVSIQTNWPNGVRQLVEAPLLLVSAAYRTALGEGKPAPGFGAAQWTPHPQTPGMSNRWTVSASVSGWRPAPGQRLELLCGPTEDGPWTAHYDSRWAKSDPPTLERQELHIGQRAYYRTRLVLTHPQFGYLGESWSEPLEVHKSPEPISISLDRREGTVFGRRGEQLQVSVQGEWMPFKAEGLKPYGPEGVTIEEFREIVRLQEETEAKLTANEKASNQDNLLGIAFEKPGGSAPATGGLQNVDYFLGKKGSFPVRELPAGALYATFTPARRSDAVYSHGEPLRIDTIGQPTWHQVSRRWIFDFPEDGIIRFAVNECGMGWVGAHLFKGSGELRIIPTIAGTPNADPSPPSPAAGAPNPTNQGRIPGN